MANIDNGFSVEILSLNDRTLITSGVGDPSIAGFEAPEGSLYLYKSGTNSTLFIKRGPGDFDWTQSVGYTGSRGVTGFTGSQGNVGYVGSASTIAGPIGYTGSQGIQGVIGYTGSAGTNGFTGSRGYTGSAGALVLNDLNDVTITTPSSNQVLMYTGSQWINSTGFATSASGILSSWTLISGNKYYADFTHGLGTKDVVVTCYNNTTNQLLFTDRIDQLTNNTIRVTVAGNTTTVRVVVVAHGAILSSSTPNVVNSLQVINAGGAPSIQQDLIANRPAASTPGRLFLSTDTKILFRDTGTSWDILTSSQGVIRTVTFYANSLDSPVNADFAIAAIAPTVTDSINAALNVRSFSNTTETGVSFMMTPPLGATVVTFKTTGRASVAQATATVVQPRLYVRSIPNDGAVSAWSAANEFSNISIPANTNYQYNSQSFTLASLGLTVGTLYQFEFTRRVTGVTGTNLPATWNMVDLTVEFT